MANSKIYFTPARTEYGPLRTIDFGERLSDLQITPYRSVSDAVSMGGFRSRVSRRSGMRVRIVLERFTDDRLAEQFYSLQSHLEVGGGFALAVDDDKKFAAYVRTLAPLSGGSWASSTGHKFLQTLGPEILSEFGAHGLAAGDVLHLESFGPGAHREELVLGSVSLGADGRDHKLTLSTAAIYEHTVPGAMVRHRDFFPYLQWPEDQMSSPILTHDHRISYTVDFSCEVYPAHVSQAAGRNSNEGSGIPNVNERRQDGRTLDGLFLNTGSTPVGTGSVEIEKMPVDMFGLK